ncbi:hypothetical protein RO21_10725 [[Actinobacillus] muris]|uniref:DNA transformation protein n=1 Tax=Muribacter muris TaxID=67855 RepID=A0A0J5S188_9PAST|nr:TfoX/Sxy family protein [Muribacter muris]KMK50637.1 hypothetical protein RO21_10725 [[Actinobacillus] muris] [Muribacter muris]
MTSADQEAQKFKQLLSTILGEINIKSYFSYYGFRKHKLLFALYKDGNFYLHIPDEIIDQLLPYDGVVQLEDKKSGIHSQNYYQLPHTLIENNALFSYWVNSCFTVLQKKHNIITKKPRLIRYMPNMNAHTEKTLKKLNIHSVDDLIAKGEINTFIALLEKGFDVDESMLFKLHCAIQHKLIYTLTPKEKIALLTEANKALYEAGLRKRFKIY